MIIKEAQPRREKKQKTGIDEELYECIRCLSQPNLDLDGFRRHFQDAITIGYTYDIETTALWSSLKRVNTMALARAREKADQKTLDELSAINLYLQTLLDIKSGALVLPDQESLVDPTAKVQKTVNRDFLFDLFLSDLTRAKLIKNGIDTIDKLLLVITGKKHLLRFSRQDQREIFLAGQEYGLRNPVIR